jgi:hypothetical protein
MIVVSGYKNKAKVNRRPLRIMRHSTIVEEDE